MEICNCEQAMYYRKEARKLANMILKWSKSGLDETKKGYTDFEFLAEIVAPQADKIIKTLRGKR